MDENKKLKLLKDCHTGNTEAFRIAKQEYPNFHWVNLIYEKTGDTALHIAAQLGHIDMLKYLLLEFNPRATNCKNKDGKTALHEAAQFAQLESAKILLDLGADVNALKRADWTPLMLACTKLQAKSFDLVELLLNNGAIVNFKNKDGWTALHLICREGDVEILKLLQKHGLNIMERTKNGRTALHVAALHAAFDMVVYLISQNLDINAVDNCGNSPLHEAILGQDIDLCRLLIASGADILCTNNEGFNLLHLAASKGCLEVLKFITNELKIDLNSKSLNGFTPLHCAARQNQEKYFRFLEACGADANVKDNYGRMAKMYFKNEG